MKVSVITATEKPLDVISFAAGTCYGKDDASEKRVRNCFKRGHMSVFEHASVTFRIEGISRACSHQLVRHRLASFCQESQRYCRYDLSGDDWFVLPKSIDFDRGINDYTYIERVIMKCGELYNDLVEHGFKPEDARYILPEATKTNLVMTMNWRELYHFWNLRTDNAAQWEIRNLANAMIGECEADNELRGLVELWKENL